jgi:hypothetical protein
VPRHLGKTRIQTQIDAFGARRRSCWCCCKAALPAAW